MKLKTILIISAFTTTLLIIIINLHGAPLKVQNLTPYGIVDLEMARTVTRATEIYNLWSPELTRHAIKNIFIDFLFLVSYAAFLYASCLTLSNSFHNMKWRRIGKILSILMIVAACFDALENLLMLRTLFNHINKEIIASTFIFASIKFLLAGIGILYIIISIIARMFSSPKKVVHLHKSQV